MAIQSPLGVKTIKDNVRALGLSVTRVKRSAFTSSKILMNRTKVKRSSIFEGRRLFERKKQAIRIKDQENIIEASKLTVPIQRGAAAIARSTQGFLGRILEFTGTLLTGWLLYNLPTLIAMAKELMGRITRMVDLLKGFVGNLGNIMGGFGNLLSASFQNIMSFDFTDSSKRVDTAMKGLQNSFKDMGSQIDEGLQLLTTPLTKGLTTGENAPGFGTRFPAQPEGGAQPSPSGTGGGRWKPLLDVIASGEGGYESVNPGQVVPGLTNMTISEAWSTAQKVGRSRGGSGAMGRYQLLSDPIGRAKKAGLDPYRDKFSPANQDKIAVYIIENIRDGKEWLSGRLRGGDAAFAQGLADEWAGVPNLSGRYSYSGQGGKVKASSVREALSKVKTEQPTPQTPASSAPTPITPSTPQKPKLDLKKLGFSVGERAGYSKSRGRPHRGRDIAIAGGTPVSVVSNATITDVGYEGGYGYFVAYVDDNGIEHFYGHLRERPKVSKGQKLAAGTIVGYVGSTGNSTGPHLHWEVSPRIGEVGRPRRNIIDPIEYGYSSSAPFGGTTPAQITPQQSQRRQQIPNQITPERRGQEIVLIDDVQPQQLVMPMGGGGGGGIIPIVINPLNSYITNKLLLDLAYT